MVSRSRLKVRDLDHLQCLRDAEPLRPDGTTFPPVFVDLRIYFPPGYAAKATNLRRTRKRLPFSHRMTHFQWVAFSSGEKRNGVCDSPCFLVDVGIFPRVGIKAQGERASASIGTPHAGHLNADMPGLSAGTGSGPLGLARTAFTDRQRRRVH